MLGSGSCADIGQFHFETDGFRTNNDQEQDIWNVFAQVSLSHKTSIQGEYRYADKEKGDLPLRFDPNEFFPTERQEENTKSYRFGFQHRFAPNCDLIGSFIYRDAQFDTVDTDPIFGFYFSTDDDGYLGELQHLYRIGKFNFITGAGYFDAVTQVINAGQSSLTALEGSTEEAQFDEAAGG